MEKGILTPLGEIQLYIDNIRSDYQVEPYICNVRSVRAKPPEGCYRIIVSAKEWHTIRCVLALCDTETINYGVGDAAGEKKNGVYKNYSGFNSDYSCAMSKCFCATKIH